MLLARHDEGGGCLKPWGLWLAGLMIVLSAPTLGFSDAPSGELDTVKSQVESLQRENKNLREQMERQAALTEQLMQKVEALAGREGPAAREIDESLEEAPQPIVKREGEPMELKIGRLPKMTVIGFGDMGFGIQRFKSLGEQGFYIGAQGLTFTSQINDRLSFLLETDFHLHAQPFEPFDDFEHFHLQRATLAYTFSDLLKLTLGKIHTALGYYNQAYHHGTYLESATFRPEIVEFEVSDIFLDRRGGGHLPTHTVGAELSGTRGLLEVGDMSYVLGLSNGRSPSAAFIETNRNTNDTLALNTQLVFKPALVDGLQVGVGYYLDQIPQQVEPFSPPTRRGIIQEQISSAHAAYFYDKTELIAELYRIHHRDKGVDAVTEDWGGFFQAAYQLTEKFRPYFRFDYMDTDASRYFTGSRQRKDNTYHLGVRWDVLPWNALKFEYSYRADQITEDAHTMSMNTSYTF